MPKIIWCGNKSWDTDFPENTLPNNAKRIERPDNIFKSSLLYGTLPLIFSYAIICIKWFMIGEKAMCSCAKFLTQILIFFDTNFSAFSGSILRKLICIFCVKINKNLYIKQHIFYNYFR